MTRQKEAMKLALDALNDSIDGIENEAKDVEILYGTCPSRQARVQYYKDQVAAHQLAINALTAALALPDVEPVATFKSVGAGVCMGAGGGGASATLAAPQPVIAPEIDRSLKIINRLTKALEKYGWENKALKSVCKALLADAAQTGIAPSTLAEPVATYWANGNLEMHAYIENAAPLYAAPQHETAWGKIQDLINDQWNYLPCKFTEAFEKIRFETDVPQPVIAQVQAWLPIQTAPKNTDVIVFLEGQQFVAEFVDDATNEWHRPSDSESDFNGLWTVDDNKLGPYALRGGSPTHWQPLLPPPGAAQATPVAKPDVAPCDMGEMCLGCTPRNAGGSCPDARPVIAPEPVAWMTTEATNGRLVWTSYLTAMKYQEEPTPLYTAAPQPVIAPLTFAPSFQSRKIK